MDYEKAWKDLKKELNKNSDTAVSLQEMFVLDGDLSQAASFQSMSHNYRYILSMMVEMEERHAKKNR